MKSWRDGINDFEASGKQSEKEMLIIEYYYRPFMLLHQDESIRNYRQKLYHDIRDRFWKLVVPRRYGQREAQDLLTTYLTTVEREMARIISQCSIAYWLHLYRRIAPRLGGGQDDRPMTIGFVRAIAEAAFQKYGKFSPCDRVSASKEIPISKILGGLLLNPEFELERKNIEELGNQLVLTNFGHHELLELYEVEKLAYEVWITGAKLRIVGKGAPLVVGEPPEYFSDERSAELNTLVEIFDCRNTRSENVSSSGVVFNSPGKEGTILLPTYNLEGILVSQINPVVRKFYKTSFPDELKFNFFWIPFNLRAFRSAHLPFGGAFETRYGVSLDSVLSVLGALVLNVLGLWEELGGGVFARYWQRAYEGPYECKAIREMVKEFIPRAATILEIEKESGNSLDVDAGLAFWELNETSRMSIDLRYPGPHHFLLPYGRDRKFIDYAWALRRLHDLFIGVWVADQNFKGEALEVSIGRESSCLPKGTCRSKDGSAKQIDYAHAVGKHLIIVECKAVGRSIGFDRGDTEAVNYRLTRVVEKALSEIDEKAIWLAKNSIGANYDVSTFDDILPIAVSPFVEFIHSLDKYYWISQGIPRVLTPNELRELLDEREWVDNSFNRIWIEK